MSKAEAIEILKRRKQFLVTRIVAWVESPNADRPNHRDRAEVSALEIAIKELERSRVKDDVETVANGRV